MRAPSTKAARAAAVAATPVAVIAAAAIVWQSSYAAFSGQTRNSGNEWSTGSVALNDDDNGAARFRVDNMVPGDTETKCIKVTANASTEGQVRGYVTNSVNATQPLADHVQFRVERGTGGSFASCTGFVADPDAPVLPKTSLASLAVDNNSWANALTGWDVTSGSETRTYKITWEFDTTGLTQEAIDAFQGKSVGLDFQWELQTN